MFFRCSCEGPLLAIIEDSMLFVWEGINLELVNTWLFGGGTVIILGWFITFDTGLSKTLFWNTIDDLLPTEEGLIQDDANIGLVITTLLMGFSGGK